MTPLHLDSSVRSSAGDVPVAIVTSRPGNSASLRRSSEQTKNEILCGVDFLTSSIARA